MEHKALKDLRALFEGESPAFGDEPGLQIGFVDPASAAQAAVLILFGQLDDAPAVADSVTDKVAADLDVLILVRAKTLRKHAGQPAFPGGKIDPEDLVLAEQVKQPVAHIAALREAVEETGLDPAGVEILGSLKTLPLPVSNFLVTPVLAWWKSSSPVRAQDKKESSLVLRVPVADLLDPARRHTATVPMGRATHKSPAFRVSSDQGDFVIWGFTGILLSRLFDQLGWTLPWNTKDMRPAPGH